MKIIAITSPTFYEGEVSFINALPSRGIDLIHLRKPEASADDCARLLGQLSGEALRRIVVHQHFEQAVEYRLRGIHLNHRHPEPLPDWRGSVSRSCHSLAEVVEWKDRCDYVFLSPIFDSISKQGYRSAFSPDVLARAAAEGVIDEKVYALGGVTFDRLPQLAAWHFGGAAMLGALR